MRVLWLGGREVKKLLTMAGALEAVEEAFRQHALGKVQMPAKLYLDFRRHGGDLRAMPAYLEEQDIAGVKIVNVHPSNPVRGLPTVMAVLVLNNPSTGAPLALMDATYLTDMRTGAAGGVAVKHLARRGSSVLGLVGAGKQAKTQLLAIAGVLKLRRVKVASRSRKGAAKFVEEVRSLVDVEYEVCGLREACDCDVLATTTPVRKPILREEWIQEGTHINAVGADAPGKQELDHGVLKKSKIFVDDLVQAQHSGEINVPLSLGLIKPGDIHGELGKVVTGELEGRSSDEEITLFDSTGLAIQDVAVGNLVYEKALEEGLGTWLSLF